MTDEEATPARVLVADDQADVREALFCAPLRQTSQNTFASEWHEVVA